MTCMHLRKLFQLCDENELKFSSSDLVHVVCKQCQQAEVCPSLLVEEYEARQSQADTDGPEEPQDASPPSEAV